MEQQFHEKQQQIIQLCQSYLNLSDFEEYPATDYNYSLREYDSPEKLKEFFSHGNWSIRTGAIFGDLAFVQQVNGGDEWLTMKKEDGEYHSFESISFGAIIKKEGAEEFFHLLDQLQTQTLAQYWGNEPESDLGISDFNE